MRPVGNPGINQRQFNQLRRIGQGVKSGELTKGETRRLLKQQKSIRGEVRQAKADGSFTKKERGHVALRQWKASADIFVGKHNNVKRGG